MTIKRVVVWWAVGLAVVAANVARAADAPAKAPPAELRAPTAVVTNTRTLTYPDALVLGVVEGITEYLPVSSTGHLIVAAHALGLDAEQPLVDRAGHVIMTMRNHEPAPLTLKDAVDNYNIIVQGGAILAVLILYWPRVWSLVRGALGADPAGRVLLRNLAVAFVPSAAVGLLLEKWIDAHLFTVAVVAAAQVVGALVMLAAEFYRKTNQPKSAQTAGPDITDLSWQQSLFIGCCQIGSLWPGMSRSMTTIVAGYFAGLRPVRAAEFSFLLGLLTLTAAAGYKAVRHGHEIISGLAVGPLVVGIVVAAITSALAVKWLVGWLTRHGLSAFAWYRIAFAAVLWYLQIS